MNVTAIFDIGRTNKKLLLFDEQYRAVEEISETLPEITDEDGVPCDDLALLTRWVQDQWDALSRRTDIQIQGVNVAAYGASLVHLDAQGNPVAPLYSYLKPFPPALAEQFYGTYGDVMTVARQTNSPPLGMLNSGLQIYWLKYTRPAVYQRVRWSLHLPQYIAYLLCGEITSDFTSIGCHTALWDFEQNRYHDWVIAEGIDQKLAPIVGQPVAGYAVTAGGEKVPVGGGLHDSSSVIMAYLARCQGPFMVLSTGTWCITLNPFQTEPLTEEQLQRDCLSFLTVGGITIRSARLLMGKEHDHQVARIAEHFQVKPDFSRQVNYRPDLLPPGKSSFMPACMTGTGPFPDQSAGSWDLAGYASAEEAYHHLLAGLVDMLTVSIQLIDNDVPVLYVDGGFARNAIFMQLLAERFRQKQVYRSQLPQATAIGAALYIRQDDEPVSGWTFEPVERRQPSVIPGD
ncbi:FGGY-family carbohydrate kinase [Nibrella saemangeumensis]|uniref:FGGY-family carbohydrate kinase n=1 Tax=Nibrella saemangeumensis TaxID=1084526 RepID=A0ABP8MUL1_9BACT